MIPKIFSDDFGWYALRYFDGDASVILPDLDASLEWKFYDSLSTLQFTANIIDSTPLIEQDSDTDGAFLKVVNIPLTGWALGLATVQAFALKNTEQIEPYPLLAVAFEIVQEVDGYCSPQDVIDHSGVKARDLEKDTGTELNSLLSGWILEASDIIEAFVNQSWSPRDTAPKLIRNSCTRMVSNLVTLSVQRRKSPIIQIGEFNIRQLEDIMLTTDIKDILTMKRKNKPLGIGLATYTRESQEELEEE